MIDPKFRIDYANGILMIYKPAKATGISKFTKTLGIPKKPMFIPKPLQHRGKQSFKERNKKIHIVSKKSKTPRYLYYQKYGHKCIQKCI